MGLEIRIQQTKQKSSREEISEKQKKMMRDQYQVARRPTPSAGSHPQPFVTNHYNFNFHGSQTTEIYKYCIDFSPEIPDSSFRLRKQIVGSAKEKIHENIGFYIMLNTAIYARKKQLSLPAFDGSHDNVDYKINIKFTITVSPGDQEQTTFLKIFANTLIRKLQYQRIGLKYFNPDMSINIPQYHLKLWPGFGVSVAGGIDATLLKLDFTHRVARTDNVLDLLSNIRNTCRGGDIQELYAKSKEQLIGKIIYTQYNNHTYRVDDLVFDKNPTLTFQAKGKDAGEMSLLEYYQKKYNITIREPRQPLIINYPRARRIVQGAPDGGSPATSGSGKISPETISQKTAGSRSPSMAPSTHIQGEPIYLIPELCSMTGLDDEMRKDFNVMKQLGTHMHKSAYDRVEECRKLLEGLNMNEKCKKVMSDWDISIEHKPVTVEGKKLMAGTLEMADGMRFQVEDNRSLDREIQNPMRSQPPLNKWGVFYSMKQQHVFDKFVGELQFATKSFHFTVNTPNCVGVPSDREGDWLQELSRAPDDVQVLILIIPGNKSRAPLYSPLKRFLIEEKPIPSQFVLASTIEKGKNLKSIVAKILIQINAKIGGVPWEMNEMPLLTKPIMIMGVGIENKGGYTINAIVATLNHSATVCYSTTVIQKGVSNEFISGMKEVVIKAIGAFKSRNKVCPQRILVYRDRLAKTQLGLITENEINPIKEAIEAIDPKTELSYILVNKRGNTKFYAGTNQDVKNPPPGSVLADKIVGKEHPEFYMISQKTLQGVASPTHYTILHMDANDKMQEFNSIQMLTYKMCYLYYNVTGSIRVPAPLRYAARLAMMLADRTSPGSPPPLPKEQLENLNTLYFIQ